MVVAVKPLPGESATSFLGTISDLGVAALTSFSIYQTIRDDGTPAPGVVTVAAEGPTGPTPTLADVFGGGGLLIAAVVVVGGLFIFFR